MTPVGAVILDVDGTLVDSNDAHARAWLETLAERGIHPVYEEVRRLIGLGGDKLLPRVSGIAAPLIALRVEIAPRWQRRLDLPCACKFCTHPRTTWPNASGIAFAVIRYRQL